MSARETLTLARESIAALTDSAPDSIAFSAFGDRAIETLASDRFDNLHPLDDDLTFCALRNLACLCMRQQREIRYLWTRYGYEVGMGRCPPPREGIAM